ncbi:hypothetical protein I3843_03G220500 [Carya illinoinensis]|uniref:Uncharacterized protein n=2 Tax=Carya illinoinensis TaxID=32201 RepID=A0A922JXD8_CARIL|nr:hypothetical protein I3760_03G228500 [Carya illinoinensis]KAG2718637.1 hypothetical protein I3760_03G228500 [Carya illinoinensis]KAG6723815.1 hypothetical protein I3842_03G226100 [Carya illinoinensis]KAG7989094.1 hypothetical protein I3843_03G220500 [Carya illinoinensis]
MVNIRPCSRNTMIKNKSDLTMKVDVMVDPGNFLSKASVPEIPAGEHRYICYVDFGIETNINRNVQVLAYFDGAQAKDKKPIPTSEIRDNKGIELTYMNGKVDYHCVKGNMIEMNGVIILMKRAARKIRSILWKLEDHKELKSVNENNRILQPDGMNNIAHGDGLGTLEPTRAGPVG